MADRIFTFGSKMADRMLTSGQDVDIWSKMADRMLSSVESKMAALPMNKFTEKYMENQINVQSAPI